MTGAVPSRKLALALNLTALALALIAAAGFSFEVWPILGPVNNTIGSIILLAMIGAPLAWLMVVAIALVRLGLRGAWSLAVAPLALFGPIVIGMLAWGCMVERQCI